MAKGRTGTLFDHLSGFSRDTEIVDGHFRAVARFDCASCDNKLLIPMAGKPVSPPRVVKQASNAGWIAYEDRSSRTACPNCQHRAKPFIVEAQMSSKNALPRVSVAPPSLTVVPTEAQPADSSPPAPDPETRRPTPDQRAAIRAAIERNFDDGRGMYLSGQSDQSIAATLDVPRRYVEQIREAAYGPIRVTAELLAVQREFETLRSDFEGARDLMREMEGRMTALALRQTALMGDPA